MLDALFTPETVAVVGASKTPGKVGHDILVNLIEGGFTGKIVPVNQAGGTIFDLEVYTHLRQYEGSIDQTIIAIPKEHVLETVKEALNKGTKSVIMVSSGFKETGEIGGYLEEEIATLCKRGGARLLGPNCLGLVNTWSKLNASFAGSMPIKGKISVFSQSGALCTALMDLAQQKFLGLSKVVSIGNKADINEEDLLKFFEKDQETDVIIGYLENIVSGDRFIKVASKISSHKPVIILKAGTSQTGQRVAAAHTGVLAGLDTAYGAAFKRSGIIRADTFDGLLDYATALSMQPLPKGKKVLIMTNAGGPGTMAADAVEHAGMEIAELTTNTIASLRNQSPLEIAVESPINILGDAPPEKYAEALIAGQNNPNVDAIIVVLAPQAMTNSLETVRRLALSVDGSKPVLATFMGNCEITEGNNELTVSNLPYYSSPERAVAALKAMYEYACWKERPPRMVTRFRVNRRRAERIITRSQRHGIYQLNEVKSKNILDAYGFATPAGRMVSSIDEAIEHARRIGFPVAMKIVSPDIVHKSDMGGVKLNLANVQQVKDAYDLMMLRIRQQSPDARIEGIDIEAMIDTGLEVILGMNRDPQFGPMLMFGLGGIFVEVLKDVTFHLAPITHDEALQMLLSTRSYDILHGKRGEKGVDVDSIATGLQRISQLTTDFPQIQELDINPFIVGEIGTEPMVVDAKITLSKPDEKVKL